MEMARQPESGKTVVGGTEGGRRPTGVPPTTVPPPPPVPSEVPEKPVRRRFSSEYKLRILEEADRCTEPGSIGALLRREGLYSSHLTAWRRQRAEHGLRGLTPKKPGRKAKLADPVAQENERLRRENERLAEQLQKARTIIEFQKKLSTLLELPLNDRPTSENDA